MENTHYMAYLCRYWLFTPRDTSRHLFHLITRKMIFDFKVSWFPFLWPWFKTRNTLSIWFLLLSSMPLAPSKQVILILIASPHAPRSVLPLDGFSATSRLASISLWWLLGSHYAIIFIYIQPLFFDIARFYFSKAACADAIIHYYTARAPVYDVAAQRHAFVWPRHTLCFWWKLISYMLDGRFHISAFRWLHLPVEAADSMAISFSISGRKCLYAGLSPQQRRWCCCWAAMH